MEIYQFIILAALAFLALLLMLRVRIRFEFSPDRKYLFVGLGKTGGEYSLSEKSGIVRISGFPVKRFQIGSKKEKKVEKPEVLKKEKKGKKKKPGRKRSFKLILKVLPGSSKAMGKYLFRLLRSLIIEDLRAEVSAGFFSPAVTGKALGYYQAAIAAVPQLNRKILFKPIWTGPALSGAAYGSIAMPVYKLIYLTLRLVFALPLRELTKLAIGTKEGGQDGGQ